MKQFPQKGFTLVELILAMTLTVIVTSFAAMFIAAPVQGYTDQTRRAELVDGAESALHRLGRDIRSALPNSIRVLSMGGGFALELLNTVDGARYRDAPPPVDLTRSLQFSTADDAFNVIGRFNRTAKPFSSTSHYLSIYNTGVPGASAWELAGVITPPGTRIDIATDAIPGEDNVVMTPAFQFAYPSPSQRVYLLDGPVTWLCDTATGMLTRYSNYDIATDQSTRDSAAELISAGAIATRVADDVTACQLDYTPGTAWRAGLVGARLELGRDNERIALLHQVHIENAP